MLVAPLYNLVVISVAAALSLPMLPYAPRERQHATLESRKVQVAAAQFDFKPFELTRICFHCVKPGDESMYSCSLSFNWFDPNSVLQNNITSTTCSSTWSWDGKTKEQGKKNTYESRYITCAMHGWSFFEMHVLDFSTANNFTLELSHQYHDSFNFTPPWEYPLTTAQPNILLQTIAHTENAMASYNAGPVYADILGVSA